MIFVVQVEGLLTRFASSLVSKRRQFEAVELYRIANKPHEAALLTGRVSSLKLLSCCCSLNSDGMCAAEIAEQKARLDVKPSLAKKLHVLAALEVERHRKRTMDMATQVPSPLSECMCGRV